MKRKTQPKVAYVRPPDPDGVWKDCTSYTQSDPYPRVPRWWRIKFGDFSVSCGTGHRYYPEGTWLANGLPSCRDSFELKAKDEASAKAETIALLRASLTEALAGMNQP